MKAQLLISLESKMIYGIASNKGKTHDFKMFKDSKLHIPSDIIRWPNLSRLKNQNLEI